jgi:glycosyltransferase involved in cell wall biosynthesis
MTFQPRVTIVTPSYNQASFLEQTMLSVLGQDYPDLEYMVVDGASSDGSVDIIRKYAAAGDAGRKLAWWVSERDHGQAEAINKGLARATGDIVAWLNSDDVYQPGAIQAAVDAFQQHPQAGLVFGDVLSIDGDNRVINLMHFGDYGLDDLVTFHIISQPGVFMRRSVLQKAGLLDTRYHYLLDHQLWLRMAREAGVVYVPRNLAAARFHAGAKNVAQAARFGQEAYNILEWMQTQPVLGDRLQALKKRAWAGAHKFNARYLLDGSQPWPALKSYARSLACHAPTALPEWHRMLYAILCLLGLERLRQPYLKLRLRLRGQSGQVMDKPTLKEPPSSL